MLDSSPLKTLPTFLETYSSQPRALTDTSFNDTSFNQSVEATSEKSFSPLNPKPQALNPKPQSLNPKPSTQTPSRALNPPAPEGL